MDSRFSFSRCVRAFATASVVSIAIFVAGCANTATTGQPRAVATPAKTSADTSATVAAAPAGSPESVTQRNTFQTASLNRQLSNVAVQSQSGSSNASEEDYQIGPGDILELAVFQVPELNRKVRVSGRGSVILPLLGEVKLGGKTSGQAEGEIARMLGEKYLQDPQVSVFIAEYRSQSITVMGSVNKPAVHNVRRPHSVLELLSLSEGLTDKSSNQIYVRSKRANETGDMVEQNFVMDLKTMMESGNLEANVMLRGGDSVYVPESGVVFVEGYVVRPGAYNMSDTVSVLKAIALAGGPQEIAQESAVQVLRQTANGATQVAAVDLRAIRENRADDITLQDGDIVIVEANMAKKRWQGFWRGFTGIFGFSKGF